LWRVYRAGVRGYVIRALGGLHPVKVKAVIDHAGDIGQRITTAEEIIQVEDGAIGVQGRVGVLCGLSIIQSDLVQQKCLRRRLVFGGAGFIESGGGQMPYGSEHDLIVTIEVKVF